MLQFLKVFFKASTHVLSPKKEKSVKNATITEYQSLDASGSKVGWAELGKRTQRSPWHRFSLFSACVSFLKPIEKLVVEGMTQLTRDAKFCRKMRKYRLISEKPNLVWRSITAKKGSRKQNENQEAEHTNVMKNMEKHGKNWWICKPIRLGI